MLAAIVEARAKVGDVLAGRYELRELLGAGGLGRVFRAWDRERRRVSALKLFDGAAVSGEAFRRYAEAVRGAAAVNHAGLVLPQAPASAGGPRFVVCEALQGADLEALRQRGPLPFARAAEVASASAEALAAVHEATGLAHRALKPGNVWITEASQTRVLDFGVAELGTTPVAARAGGVFVEYRAPEQLQGGPGDARSDVFTLAVLLLEMVTGVHPFAGPSAFKAIHRVMQSTEASLDLSGLPAQARPLLTRALARRPEDRFADARELLRALVVVRQAVGSSAPRPLERRVEPAAPAEGADEAASPVPDSTTQLRVPVMRARPVEKVAAFTPPIAPATADPGAANGDEPPLLGAGAERPARLVDGKSPPIGAASRLPALSEVEPAPLEMPRPSGDSPQIDTERLGPPPPGAGAEVITERTPPRPPLNAGAEVITERTPPRPPLNAGAEVITERTPPGSAPGEATQALPVGSPQRRGDMSEWTGRQVAAEEDAATIAMPALGRRGPEAALAGGVAVAPPNSEMSRRAGRRPEATQALPDGGTLRNDEMSRRTGPRPAEATLAQADGGTVAPPNSEMSRRTGPRPAEETLALPDGGTVALRSDEMSRRTGPRPEEATLADGGTVALPSNEMSRRTSPRPGEATLALPGNDMSRRTGPRPDEETLALPSHERPRRTGPRPEEATLALSDDDMARGTGRPAKSAEEATQVLPEFGKHLRAAAERKAAERAPAPSGPPVVQQAAESRILSGRTLITLNIALGALILAGLAVLLLR